MGALFVAGSAFEAALLLASIAFALIWGSNRPAPAAFMVLLLVGALVVAATAGLGGAMMRTVARRATVVDAPTTTNLGAVVEARAALALVAGVAAIVLIWPFGVLLGPAAFLVGLSAVRRIDRAPARLIGAGRARAGVIIGAVVSGFYLFWILVDVSAIFAFGSPIPAAP